MNKLVMCIFFGSFICFFLIDSIIATQKIISGASPISGVTSVLNHWN